MLLLSARGCSCQPRNGGGLTDVSTTLNALTMKHDHRIEQGTNVIVVIPQDSCDKPNLPMNINHSFKKKVLEKTGLSNLNFCNH